jgi:hypothetical protein
MLNLEAAVVVVQVFQVIVLRCLLVVMQVSYHLEYLPALAIPEHMVLTLPAAELVVVVVLAVLVLYLPATVLVVLVVLAEPILLAERQQDMQAEEAALLAAWADLLHLAAALALLAQIMVLTVHLALAVVVVVVGTTAEVVVATAALV